MTNTTQHPSVADDATYRDLLSNFNAACFEQAQCNVSTPEIVVADRALTAHIDTLLAAARAAGARPKKPDIVPGKMHCARCNFSLLRNILSKADGEVYAGTNETEPCPNGCGPLWPMTWEQEAHDNYKLMEGLFARAEKAEAALAEAKELLTVKDHVIAFEQRQTVELERTLAELHATTKPPA